jgi:glycosyltransferase involved in cell wall biosynthesis
MKKISVMVPCYNEEENVKPMAGALVAELEKLADYDYEILFIDNCSEDRTREYLRELCAGNKRIRAIFNIRNFGQFNSPYHGLCQTTGDCAVSICCDFQDPVEMIPRFVAEWESGCRIVCGIKTSSKENRLLYFLRSLYYKIIKKLSNVEQIEHFTGFGLYDKSFIDVLRNLNDPSPFFRGIVAELGGKRKEIPYEQQKRRAGKTKNNWYSLYDAAMLSFTSYTKAGMRLAIFIGCLFSVITLIVAAVYLVMKLIYWDRFIAGQAPTIIVVSLMCSMILFFIGVLGEYMLSINARLLNRPLVIEEERINFETDLPAKREKISAYRRP